MASGSEREDTVSQGGSESDTSRTDGRHHTRTGSVKKPTSFKPVSFAKFSVPKTPGSVLTSKIVSEKGIFPVFLCIMIGIALNARSIISFTVSIYYTTVNFATTSGR